MDCGVDFVLVGGVHKTHVDEDLVCVSVCECVCVYVSVCVCM